jgi:hypothetical protein
MRRLLLTALTILCLVAPAAAGADSGVNKLLRDACRDEHIDGTYTQAQYKEALDQLPTDSDEYTGCREVLQRGRLAALGARKRRSSATGAATGGGSSGSSGSSGATGSAGSSGSGAAGSGGDSGSSGSSGAPKADPLASATPKQRKALAQAGKTAKAVDVGGQLVQPSALGLGDLSASGRDVPTPLIALVCLLAVSALGVGGWWLWSRVLARRFG